MYVGSSSVLEFDTFVKVFNSAQPEIKPFFQMAFFIE